MALHTNTNPFGYDPEDAYAIREAVITNNDHYVDTLLPAGKYIVKLRGAGGAGGQTGSAMDYIGGKGGVGGTASLTSGTFILNNTTPARVKAGYPGTVGVGGTGGIGEGGVRQVGIGGKGGGAGTPSYLVTKKTDVDSAYSIIGNGGAGGGGGGAGGQSGLYSGAGGGGGGGDYIFGTRVSDTTLEVSETKVSGVSGGNGGSWMNTDYEFLTPGIYTCTLLAGNYQIFCRGGGGSGGDNSQPTYNTVRSGGAGGKGELKSYTVSLSTTQHITILVGKAGVTKANGGNGGNNGTLTDAGRSGSGGGGGYPSYVQIGTTYYLANGGGGGGGAGCNGHKHSNADGGNGGAGGGYYQLVNDTIVSVDGKDGGKGAIQALNGSITPGTNGTEGNTSTFPGLNSGAGADGDGGAGYLGASGGGASGGGGNCGNGSAANSTSGSGGGGAGGSTDAGGGQGGYEATYTAQNGSNYHTIPTEVVSENATCGVTGDYGRGGTPSTNGIGGFVLIKHVS